MLSQRLKVGGADGKIAILVGEKISNLLCIFLKMHLKNSQSLCLKFSIMLLLFLNLIDKNSQSDL